MRTTMKFFAALLALALFVPQAHSQIKSPATAPAQDPRLHKKPMTQTAEARWNSMLQSAGLLSREGTETRRITPQEAQVINTEISRINAAIAGARQGGVSEAEEDQIDNAIATLFDRFAGYMADPARKKVAVVKPRPGVPVAGGKPTLDKKTRMTKRWSTMLEDASVLGREGEESGRVTAAERKQIEEQIVRLKTLIARSGGVSEAEEDLVDDQIAGMYRNITAYMSDPERKRRFPFKRP
jgi:tellurite resistance protein